MAIRIPIISDFDSKGLDSAIKEFQQLEGVGAKSAFALKKAAIPAAAALGGLAVALGDATKSAMEDAAAQDQLAGVLARSGLATEDQIALNERWITSMSQATATADDDLRPALATLVQSTGSLEYSQELLSQALDISASTGNDLSTTVDALSKAYNGNMKGLKSLDASLIPMIKDGASFDEVMTALAATTGGAAADAANTAAGQMKNLSIQLGEAKEGIGAALLPVVQAIIPYFIQFATWLQENTKLVLIIAGVIGGLATVILTLNFAMKAWTAIQTIVNGLTLAWNALLAANPITIVILAVVAFIAILTALYFKFDGVRKVVDTVFQAIKTGVTASLDFLGDYVQGVLNIYKTIFNTIARLWNSTIGKLSFEFPSWVPGLGGKGFSVPNIPMLAEGGIVTQPTLAMIGEAGPEAVVPLNRAGGFANVTVNVTGGLATSAEIGQAVINAIRAYNRTGGPANILVA
jgi:hypothetical protein